MRKIKRKEIRNMIHTNICIILMILVVLILTIAYKYITYKKEVQASLETSVNVEELYNTTNREEANIKEEENKKEKDINSTTSDWELLLVNKNHKVPKGYTVELEEIETVHQVDKRIVEPLKQMLADARKEGLLPLICSSYRTNAKQQKLYNNKVREYERWGCGSEEAKEFASYWVAIPGTGEHETGLAVDIVSKDYQILDEKQEQTDVQRWLIDNSYKYGFALRYPTDKKEITMINYEPWHYRYVGVDNATYMKEHDMCLEEYIDYLKEFEEEEYKEIIL